MIFLRREGYTYIGTPKLHPNLGFIFRKFDKKMSSGMVLLDVAKVFDSKWI
jgi:hypothetical protein